jgi:antitoxin CptB
VRAAATQRTAVGSDLLDARGLSKLKWRCRRGLLENDLFIERFFRRHEATLTVAQAQALLALMDLPDNDLLDLLFGRTLPTGELARDDVLDVLGLLRTGPTLAAAEQLPREDQNPAAP